MCLPEKYCGNCNHEYCNIDKQPCKDCRGYDKWEHDGTDVDGEGRGE